MQAAASFPGRRVSATQTDTGFKREVVTDEAGSYSFPGIPVGPYKLEVTLQGFRTSVQTGIVLQVNSNPIVPVTLALGEIAETITVQANAQVVETRSLGVGQVMDNKRILDLPLNGRNPADLLQYLPAAVPQAVVLSSSAMSGSGGALSYSLGGGLAFGVAYVLDGTMHNDPRNNLNLPLPFPDALQEFQAETSAMTARNGMHSGAAVSAVTKSGTNSFRGDLFEFFRHHRFNATDPFGTKNPDGSRKDDGLKRNQYGATIGGPIKTDRLFFFFGYQGTNTTVNPTDNRAFVPTAAMLAGDFTAFASPACNAGVQRNLGAPFPGNRVDPALFSKAALNITSRLPTTTDPCGLVQYGLPSATDEGQYVTKIDYTMGARHSLFGRHIVTTQFSPAPFTLESAQQNVLATRVGGRDNKVHTFTLGENWVISPTTLNAVRFASNRSDISRPNIDFFSPQDVGINSYSYLQHYMLLNVTGGFTLGTGTETPTNIVTPSWQISDDLTLVRGGHQYVFGGSFARWGTESHGNVRSPGQFSIDGTQTGLGLADFLLGRMGTNALVQAAPNTFDMEQKYLGLYAQDTWRVGPRLTLNYGVRWEPFFPQQLVNGAVYQFDMARFQAGTKSTVFPNAPAGLYFPGDPGFPSQAGMPTDWNNFGPRVGLAWDPAGDGKTSVRASYGKSFEFVNGQFHLNTSVAPPWGSEVRLNAPPGGLDDPFLGSPGGQTNIFPGHVRPERGVLAQRAVPEPDQRSGVDQRPLLQRHRRTPAQRAVVCDRRLHRQPDEQYLGVHPAQQRALHPGPRHQRAAEHRQHQQSPAAQPDRSEQRQVLRAVGPVRERRQPALQRHGADAPRRHPVDDRERQLHAVALLRVPRGRRLLDHERGTGYNIPSDPGFDDGNCAADRLHNFSLTASIQSPRLDNPAMRAVFSDWRLVGGFRKLSGPWLTVSTGSDIALNGQVGTQRANQLLDDPYADMSINPANGGMRFLNPAAFAQPAAGTLGNSRRNSIRGMGTRSLDMSLTRVIRVTGTRDIEVRVDAFNAFNWFQWGQPATALNNLATFGQITTAGAPRAMQFAIKYRF